MSNDRSTWRKSSFSTGSQSCIEVSDRGPHVWLRDSKHPDTGHVTFARPQLAGLVTAATTGSLDPLA